MRLLSDLADIAEDLLFCGVKPPEIPPRSFHHAQRMAAMRISPGADDDGSSEEARVVMATHFYPRLSETRDLMWQSIRLVLMSRRLLLIDSPTAARLGGAIGDLATQIFNAYCSMTPRWLICEWLLENPPPPPHWESTILHAVSFIDAGARMGGAMGDELQATGAAIIDELLTLERA